MQEQTNDEPLEYHVNLMQEEQEEETSPDKPSFINHATCLYKELEPKYRVPLDPFQEGFCQKKFNEGDGPRLIMEYLRAMAWENPNPQFGERIEAYIAKETDGSQKPGWYKLLPGDQHGGKAIGPGTYHYYHPHFIASVGCFVLKPGD